MVKVQRSGRPILLDTEFWPFVQENSRDLPIDRLPATNVLRPGSDGSLITGDSNIAHTRWRATYRRADALKWAQNVHPEQEERMLRSIISRGVIHAVAQTPIERLLKQSSDDQGSVASMAKELAQSMIDGMGLGIEIERLYLDDKVPPLRVRPNFVAVESASSKSAKERADAEGEASETLSAVAGEAALPLLEMVTDYEVAISTGDAPGAEGILSKIHAVLDGEPVEVDGQMIQFRVAGEVSAIMSEARLYASREVSSRRAEYSMFRARADQFAQNPDLTLRQAWLDAYTRLQSRDMVQTLVLPPGARGVELIINQDPQIIKDLDRAYKRTATERAAEQRKLQQQRDKYRTETGVRPET
jgi:regulator of protease activity HflC (stomatin/prohibitin superfamily)